LPSRRSLSGTFDKIVVRWQYSGTHSGVGLSAAKGKKVQATGMSLLHVELLFTDKF
jgi:hypothetical protein